MFLAVLPELIPKGATGEQTAQIQDVVHTLHRPMPAREFAALAVQQRGVSLTCPQLRTKYDFRNQPIGMTAAAEQQQS